MALRDELVTNNHSNCDRGSENVPSTRSPRPGCSTRTRVRSREARTRENLKHRLHAHDMTHESMSL